MKPTKFQALVQGKVQQGKSLLLVAPTGLGKTFAVVGDIQKGFRKIIYAVPLRALGGGIREAIFDLKREGKPISAVIHHGDAQESLLFSEEVIVTTYDQVVCGVPGLPLSLPLKAGHAVAGALLMSRLVLDEVHLAWGISNEALTILLAIIEFRRKLGLQTVILTATLPDAVSHQIAERLKLERIIVGEKDSADDEGLELRECNREVILSVLEFKNKGKDSEKQLDYTPLDQKLSSSQGKRIYFANTVERLQQTYDRLIKEGMDQEKITVLHNRMPRSWRAAAEKQVHERFGKESSDGDWLLLTNQVAEAGLDISAPVVISDPAPVDTLVQRAGRCARWFRGGKTRGEFLVLKAPKAELEDRKKGLALPYQAALVQSALVSLPIGKLSWQEERKWINTAWGGDAKKAQKEVERSLTRTTFALNLFDRAAQERSPGEIAHVFREILSVEVAVEDVVTSRDLQDLLDQGQRPETSSVSLARAFQLLREVKGGAKVIRYDEGDLQIETANFVRPGETLIVPSAVVYLHRIKGLCFGNGSEAAGQKEVILSSEWKSERVGVESLPREGGHRQGLLDHVVGVMEGTYQRLVEDGVYRTTLAQILKALEPEKDSGALAAVIAQVAKLAAGFHDLGKTDQKWQAKARAIDPECPDGLIGRTLKTASRIGIPHTPPGYLATLKACELLMGPLNSSEHLIRAIALAAVRHHSSLLNPALVDYQFEPHPQALQFVQAVLEQVQAPEHVTNQAQDILAAAREIPPKEKVPLLFPNDDLFPLYALVGRAILMADRENAAGKALEQWRARS